MQSFVSRLSSDIYEYLAFHTWWSDGLLYALLAALLFLIPLYIFRNELRELLGTMPSRLARAVRVTLITVYLIVFAAALSTCYIAPDPFSFAQRHIDPGMPRTDAIAVLGQHSWYHQPCVENARLVDLFFFGDRRYDRAFVVILSSESKSGSYRVTDVSTQDNYLWQFEYKDCIQEERFER